MAMMAGDLAEADEITVTAEMIRVGVDVWESWDGSAVREQIVTEVYIAMRKVDAAIAAESA